MDIFSQKDPRWAGLPLGTSPYAMGPYGCLTTAHAQALLIAGYPVDPGSVVQALNAAGAYTDENYPAGSGLLLWYRVSAAYPEYRFHNDDTGQYRFVQVIATYATGRFEHWVLNVRGEGDCYDPLDGTYGPMKGNYRPTGLVRSADIDQAVPVPVHAFPCDVKVLDLKDGDGNPANLNERRDHSLGSEIVYALSPGYAFTVVGKAEGDQYELNGVTGTLWLNTRNGWWVAAAGTDYTPN